MLTRLVEQVRSRVANRAPGPRGRILLLSLTRLAWGDKLRELQRLIRRHGPVVRIDAGPRVYHLVNDPALVQRVLQHDNAHYPKGLNYAQVKHLVGNGLFTSEGSTWLRQRRLAQPAFHRDKIAALASTMTAATAEHLDRWRGLGERVDLAHEMTGLALDIVCRTLFGTVGDGLIDQVGPALRTAIPWLDRRVMSLVRLPPAIPTPWNLRARRAISVLDQTVFRIIRDRRQAGGDGPDLLAGFLALRDEQTGEGMNDRQLRDEMLTMLIAGHESTASALTFAFQLLATHPEVLARVRGEVDRVLAGRTPGVADLPSLPTVRTVIDETLRLYPPMWWMERQAVERDELAGFSIPAGSIIGVSPYLLHRDPDLWPDPDRFDPDRFAAGGGDRHRFAYLPFGGGPRICIGNGFALLEMQLVVAMVVQRFDWQLAPGFQLRLEPVGMLRSATGLPVRLRARQPA